LQMRHKEFYFQKSSTKFLNNSNDWFENNSMWCTDKSKASENRTLAFLFL